MKIMQHTISATVARFNIY